MRKLLLVLVGVVVFGGGEQLSAEVIFSDTTFASADWLAESGPTWLLFGQRPSNQGTSFTAMQEATGGSGGGAYRFMTHSLPPNSSMAVAHINLLATYDPQGQGAVSEVAYREDNIVFEPPFPGAAAGVAVLLRQAGQDYVAGWSSYSNTTWQSWEIAGLTETDFVNRSGGHPDFSASAAPIDLGYLRWNGTTAGYDRQHGIDNWEVTITPIPEPSTLVLLGVGAAGLAGYACRKTRCRGRSGVPVLRRFWRRCRR